MYFNTLHKHCWTRISNEYITSPREFHSFKAKRIGHPCISECDMLIIKKEHIQREKWRIDKVDQLLESSDKNVRGAVAIAMDKKGK